MRFARFVLANLIRRPLRTSLTALTIAASIFIFTALLSLDQGVKRMVIETAGGTGNEQVIAVFDKYKACPPDSLLPVRYRERIEEIDHVAEVMPVRFLLSSCQMVTDLVAVHGVEPERLRRFRRFDLPDDQYSTFAGERGAAIVGRSIANKYGWRIGDSVTLQQLGGVSFIIRGVFDAPGSSIDSAIFVDREYLEYAVDQVGIATMFLVRVDEPRHLDAVSIAIDEVLMRDTTPTRSGPERAFIMSLIDDFSSMVAFSQVVAWAALALLLAAIANNVSMGLRDRLREMSILKTIGFRSGKVARLIIAEAVLLGVGASLLGCTAAYATITLGRFAVSVEGYTILPHFSVGIAAVAIAAGALLGLIGSLMPVLRATRVPIVAGLREVG